MFCAKILKLSNIFDRNSPEELEALKQLRSDNSIVIKKADKGSTVVIMNRDDYIAEVERQLNNSKFYKKLDDNPKEQFQKDVIEVLENIKITLVLEVIELQYFMSCQKYIKHWILNFL